MDIKELNEYVEQTIKEAENIDQLNSKTMRRLLPLLTKYYADNSSQREIIEKALDDDQNSFDELARKFEASPDEQKIFQKYIRYNKARRIQEEKESAKMQQECTMEGSKFDRRHPHIWFSMELKKVNKLLKYLSLYTMQKGYYDKLQTKDSSLSLKVGQMQIQKRENDVELIIPVISGCFMKDGCKHEFKCKYLRAIYKQDKFYHNAHISETGILADVEALDNASWYTESDINIADSDFSELLKRLPKKIAQTNMQMDLKGINLTIKTLLKWNDPDSICFQMFINTINLDDISFTTQILCPPDTLYIRNAPILYTYMRKMVIAKLENYGFNEYDKLVTDDVNGVKNTCHIHNLKMDGRDANFFDFQMRLNPDERAIELWIKGEVVVCKGYKNFEMRTRVFYDISCENNKFRISLKMEKNKSYWVWTYAYWSDIKDKVTESARAQCEEIEKALNGIAFEWEYPFIFSFSDIEMYDKNGCVSLKYSLDI